MPVKTGHSRGSKRVANVKIKPVPAPQLQATRTVSKKRTRVNVDGEGESDTEEAAGEAASSSPEKEQRPLRGFVLCCSGFPGIVKVRQRRKKKVLQEF
jgi:hypothetical protein